ncbi:MAG: hypothetical protein CMJ32_03995 [Phycisphaerae bacterium]|nr:hypothetical protein [Phycisphaerae bacterium]
MHGCSTIEFCCLGSGSSGNATLVHVHARSGTRTILIDAGLGPRTCARRLSDIGLEMPRLDAILLTHLDSDHFKSSWANTIRRDQVDVHCHRGDHREAIESGVPPAAIRLFDDELELAADISTRCIKLPHDRTGTAGFVLEADGSRLGFATDLGSLNDAFMDTFVDLDILAIESNYDPGMLRNSDRPTFINDRVRSHHGHLENQDALDAARRIATGGRLDHLVLLHLSRQCNCPELIRGLYRDQAPELLEILTITTHDQPSPILRVGMMPLFNHA